MMPDFEKFRANGTDYTVHDPNAIHDLSAYRTASQQDTIDAGKLDKSGGTMTGDLYMDNARLYFRDTINMVLDGTSFVGMSTNYFNFGLKTKTARLRGSALRPTYLRGDESSSSELALLSDLNGKAEIDDTAGDGDTGKTWSADKLTDIIGDIESAIQTIRGVSA